MAGWKNRKTSKLVRRQESLRAEAAELVAQLEAMSGEADYHATQGLVADDGNVAAEGRAWQRQIAALSRRLDAVRAELGRVDMELALAHIATVNDPGDLLG
jgi:FtsZ-binding cell division protein ZapB